MTVERRRALVERMFVEAEQRGHSLEGDPKFRAWVDQWVEFEIDADELKRRYEGLLNQRREERQRKWEARLAKLTKPASAQIAEPSPEDDTKLVNPLEVALVSLAKDGDENAMPSAP